MIFQVGGDRQFAPVKRGVANAGKAFIRGDFKRDKIPAGAGNKYFGFNNLHFSTFMDCDSECLKFKRRCTTIQVKKGE